MINENIDYYVLPYTLGGLLYVPALNENFAPKLTSGSIPGLRSAAICLEDAIQDNAVTLAEKVLMHTLRRIYDYSSGVGDTADLPCLFIRVRSPEHLLYVHDMIGALEDIVCGYILPKFDCSNGQKYAENIMKLNQRAGSVVFAMPILESRAVADVSGRVSSLSSIKQITDSMKKYVLNIRVGGNDFCSLYGLRRSVDQTIYDVGVVRDVLSDIINVFSFDYTVSAPVWEYYGGQGFGTKWKSGLMRELKLDMLNGFIGKTAIHPSQLPVINDALRVSRNDYSDALAIINWNKENSGVDKSADGTRMNEVKCHRRWAQKMKLLGDIYGTEENA